MKLAGLMLVRNEAWILRASIRAALSWCDFLVILDHCSTDDTPHIIADATLDFPNRIVVLHESDPIWKEMHHRQQTLETARRFGATHMAIVDADEILCCNVPFSQLRGLIEHLPSGRYLETHMACMWRSLDKYRVGQSIWANRSDLCLAFKDHLKLTWKPVNGYDHHNRAPLNSGVGATFRNVRIGDVPTVMHLQFASWRRLTAKHAQYKIMERIKYPQKSIVEIDRMYSMALDEAGLQTSTVPESWWGKDNGGHTPLRRFIELDHIPYQEELCEKATHQYGLDYFKGLNLFGVVKTEQLVS